MLVIDYRSDIVNSKGRTVRKARVVRMVRDWHPSFIGRSYIPKVNHVHEDQIWLQTGLGAVRSKALAQTHHPAGPDLAVSTTRGAGAPQTKE